METMIIDRGRGPEVAGTRITVFDVLDYLEEGWHPTAIASLFRISSAQVEAAIRYIAEHREDVQREYDRILARAARGNPPELQARLDAAHARFLEEARRRARTTRAEDEHAGHPGRQ